MPSKALEANLALSKVEVKIEKRYEILLHVFEGYFGLQESLRGFLKEVCHPYRNWAYILKEARNYTLNYLHVFENHPRGPDAVRVYMDIYLQAIENSSDDKVRTDAADNILLFSQRILRDGGGKNYQLLPVLSDIFDCIYSLPHELFQLFVKSFYQIKKIGELSLGISTENDHKFVKGFIGALNKLLMRYYAGTYEYWMSQKDPLTWFLGEVGWASASGSLRKIFEPITHNYIKDKLAALDEIAGNHDVESVETLHHLVQLPGFGDILNTYKGIPHKLRSLDENRGHGDLWKLMFLIHLMNIESLATIHEEVLREINRTLRWLISNEHPDVIYEYLEKTFDILKTGVSRFPGAALNCILNMGEGVYKTDESDMVDFFIDSVVSLGFQAPQIRGVRDDWQLEANPFHIQNIRCWMGLIRLKPKWSKKLLSSLIIHLALNGVLIKDTDLFPRDLTNFLNSDIGPVYNLVKQFARLLPIYFNDIGAEGRLRDISTKIDEICLRKDPLIHFLRKQSHVESSNRIVGLMEATLKFWKTKSKEHLAGYIPPNIFSQVAANGQFVEGVHRVINRLFEVEKINQIHQLLNITNGNVRNKIGGLAHVTDLDIKRVEMAIELYKLLYQKYEFAFTEMEGYLSQLQGSGLPDLDQLYSALGEPSRDRKLEKLLSYMERLRAIILSPEVFEIREDIYRKRHFTVDIPSMYGSYHELKFDALGLTFRLESLVNILFEQVVEELGLEFITRGTISKIYYYLKLFDRALNLDGISSLEMRRQLDLLSHSLEIRGFSSSQFGDIFRGFAQSVKNIVNDYFNNIHQNNIQKILNQMPKEHLLEKYRAWEDDADHERFVHRITEIFLRDRIASSLALQQLDLFLSRILNTLYKQADRLDKSSLRLLLNYDPEKTITPIWPVKSNVADLIHLGNKGLNLVRLKSYGFPVPSGFIVTTEVFRCREIVENYEPAKRDFEYQVEHQISQLERHTGKSFGNPKNPLLLSVRSGSSISQPGMMNTFLDVGINEEIIQGLTARTQNPWFAWDTYRRFLQSYGMAFGIDRDKFDNVISEYKDHLGLPYKRDFTGEQMRDVALAYRTLILDHGIEVENSPTKQLFIAISKVFDSWFADKARTYRKIMEISDDWGTAVTVQAMVYGNFSAQSGSGVFFTHNPRWSGDMLTLWGDFTLGNQGEDVVSGLVRTLPVSRKQAEIEKRDVDTSLEVLFPEIYKSLRSWSKELIYERRWSPQEIEFTFEGPGPEDLYFLQTRDMVMRERKKVYSFDVVQDGPVKFIGRGIGVSGGAMTGRVVFSLQEINYWREKEPSTDLILVRADTVPDDIKEIYEADGLLTARGGSTSHAAIVAHRLDKTCVVGCSNLICMEKDKRCAFDSVLLRSGDKISIDGTKGSVYLGHMKIKEIEGV